jgi:hypothetical protein
MKARDTHVKQSSLSLPKGSSEARWESPARTPTTVTSFSFSSQDFAVSHRCQLPTHSKAKGPKSFQEEYLEFGLWPDLPMQRQADLKAKYRAQKIRAIMAQADTQRLRRELHTVAIAPCPTCAAEKTQHESTKRALEEAVALSSALLRQVLDTRNAKQQRRSSVPRCVNDPTHIQD